MYAVCAHASVYRPEARRLPQFPFILFFETVSGTKQRAHQWSRQAGQRTLEIFLSPPLPPALEITDIWARIPLYGYWEFGIRFSNLDYSRYCTNWTVSPDPRWRLWMLGVEHYGLKGLRVKCESKVKDSFNCQLDITHNHMARGSIIVYTGMDWRYVCRGWP